MFIEYFIQQKRIKSYFLTIIYKHKLIYIYNRIVDKIYINEHNEQGRIEN